jgi:D-3-phosphoglycerate dehydrogenase / 2-oxoglutarate reductase
VRIIRQFKETGQVPNVVNLARQTPATHRLVVRHVDRPGVLAGVLDAIKSEQINVQEMENIVFEGAAAAVARINLDNAPSDAILDRIRSGSADVIELNLIQLGSQ